MPIINVEYRSVIKFLVLRGKSREDIIYELKQGYGEECPSCPTIYRWYNEYRNGRTTVEDGDRCGRPVEIDENLSSKLIEIVRTERRITTRELCQRLKVSKGFINNILQSCGIRKLCSRFVARLLTHDMMEKRLKACVDNLSTLASTGNLFLQNIVTVDETPLSLYLPESKRESSEWKLPGEKASRKNRTSATHRKALMLTIFWDSTGLILIDFLPNGTTITGEYYSTLVREMRKKRRKSRVSELYFLHDNAPVHTARVTSSTLDCSGMVVLQHPPYSPDLAPSDFYLFKHMKKELRGIRYDNIEDLKEAVMLYLEKQTPDFFKKAFVELEHRWRKCVAENGSYIEK